MGRFKRYRLEYIGDTLTYYNDEGGIDSQYWFVTFGRNGSLDRTKENEGPIPYGKYTLCASEISDKLPIKWIEWNIKGDWGFYRVPLHPNSGTDTHGRDGFFMHGGFIPGSAGCIDVGPISQFDIFPKLKNHGRCITVEVLPNLFA